MNPCSRADTGCMGRDQTRHLLPDLAYKRIYFVNVIFCGSCHHWTLIDTGMPGMGQALLKVAQRRFDAKPPQAIVLTHGHGDHVGSLMELACQWRVPLYAHPLEIPYLLGSRSYPFPKRWSSLAYQHQLDLSPWLLPLPLDGTVPSLPGWNWVHTPGHTEGHISLWRESDRTLIGGDALATTGQEWPCHAGTHSLEMHGPPQGLTQDWAAAGESLKRLARLEPELLIPGHGRAVRGEAMRQSLKQLAETFLEVALPRNILNSTGLRPK